MIKLHQARRMLDIDGKRVELTKAELSLLIVFYTMGSRVASMDLLIETALAHPVKVEQDKLIIHNLIHRLRKKISPRIIETKKGAGYLLTEEIRIVDRAEGNA